MSEPARKRPRRLRLMRFSLRSMLVLTTLLCLLMGTWSLYVEPYRRQAECVKWTQEHGGEVVQQTATGPEWQAWLVRRMVGANAFVEVEQATLTGVDDPLGARSHLDGFRFAERLTLDHLALDDQAGVMLSNFKQLDQLSLRYTSVSDQGVAWLSDSPSLVKLHLTGTAVTDAGLTALASCESLENLFIRWTDITEEGVARFRSFRPDCSVHYHSLNRQEE